MDIDVSKENIQPLRGGRNLLQLGTALQAQSDHDVQRQLLLQKEEHEAAIRNYQGTDPLDPWFNYIQWVEQSFPKHGHEGHIDNLIKDCLQLFEKEEKYFQDRRFVKLWIKYIDCLTNPLEIYQRLYNGGIGVQCSEFYRAWACYCEESSDYKKANQVYMLGIQANAQPLDELEQAHMNFQLFFAQQMLHDDSPTKRKAAFALAETRMALTSLKSFKRRNIANAPIQRVGDTVRSVIPGVVRQNLNHDSRMPNSNIMLNVYEDAPSTSTSAHVPSAENPGPASLVQAYGNLENEKEVGIWTNAKIKMVHANVVPHQPLPFTPYEDEDDALKLSPNHMSHCTDDLCFDVPLCVPDPPDPTKISCYNKSEVYVDKMEYSLEEIRSRKYELKKNFPIEPVKEDVSLVNPSNQVERLSQCSALETLANCALDNDPDHIAQLMPLTMPPTFQKITKVQNIHSPGETKVLVNLDSKEFSELANPVKKENDEIVKQNIDKENHIQRPTTSQNISNENVANNYGKNCFLNEFDKSIMGNLLGESITATTKEVRWELRNLFNGNEASMVQQVVQQFDIPNFNIHEDRSITMALHSKKKTLQEHITSPPEDKENANKYTAPMISSTPINPSLQNDNRSVGYDEPPACTQVFNINIMKASTPNLSQFKKPTSYVDQTCKSSIPKFNIDDSVIEHPVDNGSMKKDDTSQSVVRLDQHPTAENQGAGLSAIMEATREYNSKSGSSSSGHQSTRTTFTGYTTTPYSEKTQASNYDSLYHQQNDGTSKRSSISNQHRLPNGQFSRMYAQKQLAESKVATPSTSVPYQLAHDHQYQKPIPQGYNGFSVQRTMQTHSYQQNYVPTYQQGYGANQIMSQQVSAQQGYTSPNANYHSPQHPGLKSPHHAGSPVHPGFQSPPLHYAQSQPGYQSPAHPMQSYPNTMRQEYQHMQSDYTNPVELQHTYVNHAPQQAVYQSQNNHQNQYQNSQYYQRPNVASSPVNSNYHGQQGYQGMQNSQYNNNAYNNYNQQQTYQHPPKQVENISSGFAAPNTYNSFQIYQSPTPPAQSNVQRNVVQQPALQHEKFQAKQTSDLKNELNTSKISKHGDSEKDIQHTNSNLIQQTQPSNSHKSPTSALRSIRHEQPNAKIGQNSPDIGFSNQFLNFISARNEPKDNANTPKFSNSPSISQKMHKNLYVSSPEQGQVPPSSCSSDSESKDGMTAQIGTTIQAAKVSQIPDKSKDISKRQLDFEHRAELQSEDSRDSVSKESRVSSNSRQSDLNDGNGMDIDSESSMECAAFKSNHSISGVDTSDIPRPAHIDFPDVIDPFNKKIIKSLLEYVKFPNNTHAEGYFEVRSVPKLQIGFSFIVGNSKFHVEKQLGKGNYGAVFLCNDTRRNRDVAVKYQKPSRPWEFYICQEIKARINMKNRHMLPGYMNITNAYLGENASLFVSEFSRYGSLLDVANKIKMATTKCINEFIVFLLTSEMLSIVHYLHKAQIIHADIKPDNFLLMTMPVQEWRTPSLQLIDMGCAIDMSLFPEGTTFKELIATEGFTCTEMRDGKPWTYQTDLYCLAGTIHVILMGSYMKVANRLGQWNIDKKLPRYLKVNLWDKIFTSLLNVPDCNTLPDLMDLKSDIDSLLSGIDNLGSQLRNFANVLQSR